LVPPDKLGLNTPRHPDSGNAKSSSHSASVPQKDFPLDSETRNWCVAIRQRDEWLFCGIVGGLTPTVVTNSHSAGSTWSNCRQVRTVFCPGRFLPCANLVSCSYYTVHGLVSESVQPPRSNLDETRCHRGLDTTRQTGVSPSSKARPTSADAPARSAIWVKSRLRCAQQIYVVRPLASCSTITVTGENS